MNLSRTRKKSSNCWHDPAPCEGTVGEMKLDQLIERGVSENLKDFSGEDVRQRIGHLAELREDQRPLLTRCDFLTDFDKP